MNVKRSLVILFFILTVFPNFAESQQTAGIQPKELMKKMQSASKNTKRMRETTTIETKSRFQSMTTEGVVDYDFENKIAHSTSVVKACDFNNDPETIKAYEELTHKSWEEYKKNSIAMMKNVKTETFCIGDVEYRKIRGKWIKIKSYASPLVLKMKLHEGSGTEEDAQKMAKENIPAYIIPTLSSVSNSFENICDHAVISEGNFTGIPCYILTLPSGNLSSEISKTPLMQGSTMNARNFISKDNYLPIVVETTITSSEHGHNTQTRFTLVTTYPKDKIEVPSELASAQELTDDEFKKLELEDMLGEFGKVIHAQQ